MDATEQREVSLFNRVDFRGIGRLILSQGEKRSVTVTASEVVLPHVRTDVRDGVLIVSFRWWPGMLFRIAEMKTLEVQLIVEELAGLKVSGAGVVQSREKIQVKEMDIHLSGAGEISLELQGRRVQTRLTGAGRHCALGGGGGTGDSSDRRRFNSGGKPGDPQRTGPHQRRGGMSCPCYRDAGCQAQRCGEHSLPWKSEDSKSDDRTGNSGNDGLADRMGDGASYTASMNFDLNSKIYFPWPRRNS